ncbi:MAG TPA: Fe(2+)-trafficking protein [Vicinamibacteria bacterium]|nr:Fe(2+)-trafficking protein [Vicinamibacteria bacterium]
MSITCSRCGTTGEPPPPHRVGFSGPDRERVLASICKSCWGEWEATEVKVINEYRLNFLDPQHREMLKKATLDFLFAQRNLNLPE